MKRFYELLPKDVVAKVRLLSALAERLAGEQLDTPRRVFSLEQIRRVIEFNNGASDTHVFGAGMDAPPLFRQPYRIALGWVARVESR